MKRFLVFLMAMLLVLALPSVAMARTRTKITYKVTGAPTNAWGQYCTSYAVPAQLQVRLTDSRGRAIRNANVSIYYSGVLVTKGQSGKYATVKTDKRGYAKLKFNQFGINKWVACYSGNRKYKPSKSKNFWTTMNNAPFSGNDFPWGSEKSGWSKGWLQMWANPNDITSFVGTGTVGYSQPLYLLVWSSYETSVTIYQNDQPVFHSDSLPANYNWEEPTKWFMWLPPSPGQYRFEYHVSQPSLAIPVLTVFVL